MSEKKTNRLKIEEGFKELSPGEETFYMHEESGNTILTCVGSSPNKTYILRVETELGNKYYMSLKEYVDLINRYYIYIGCT